MGSDRVGLERRVVARDDEDTEAAVDGRRRHLGHRGVLRDRRLDLFRAQNPVARREGELQAPVHAELPGFVEESHVARSEPSVVVEGRRILGRGVAGEHGRTGETDLAGLARRRTASRLRKRSRPSMPGAGSPAEPARRGRARGCRAASPADSVSPYPTRTGTPRPLSTVSAASAVGAPPPHWSARSAGREACRAASATNALGSRASVAPLRAASSSGSRPGTKKIASAPTASALRAPRTNPKICAGDRPMATRSTAVTSPHDSNASAAAPRLPSVRGTARPWPTLPEE